MSFFLELFYDPVFRGPFWGSIFMSIASAIVGCIALAKKKALFGESISHSAYPGVILSVLISGSLGCQTEGLFTVCLLIFGLLFGLLGFFLIELLSEKYHISSDVAQCYILSSFLGFGIVLASIIQKSHGLWYRKSLSFLYGQAATMGDFHIILYGLFACVIILFVCCFFPYIKAYLFDFSFCRQMGFNAIFLRLSLIVLFSLTVVLGMKTAGTVLMCGMIVAPAIFAMHISQKFSRILIIAPLIGAVSAALGIFLSFILSESLMFGSFATGPCIVIVNAFFCFMAFLFSSKKGFVVCYCRRVHFKKRCLEDHILKTLWKMQHQTISRQEIIGKHLSSKMMTYFCLYRLYQNGWLQKDVFHHYQLTKDGQKKAAYIIRLHRLWELYLSKHLGFSSHQIHKSAEEMEHVISPEMEKTLTQLLLDPKKDPHDQPIPQKEWLL